MARKTRRQGELRLPRSINRVELGQELPAFPHRLLGQPGKHDAYFKKAHAGPIRPASEMAGISSFGAIKKPECSTARPAHLKMTRAKVSGPLCGGARKCMTPACVTIDRKGSPPRSI